MDRPETGFIPSKPGGIPPYRRRTLYVLLGFIALSFGIHATLGPTVTAISPIFRIADTPDQGVSVVTLSRAKLAKVDPTPTPTPPPKIYRRTIANLAPLKYLEAGIRALRRAITPPARRAAMLSVHPGVEPSPTAGPDAGAATDEVPAKTPASNMSAQADTGADRSRIAGTVVWGDDNPPHLLQLASFSGASSTAGRHVRLEVDVGPDGDVLNVRVVISSGDSTLDAAAVDAARHSTFRPATLNGLPVHGTCTIDIPQANTTAT
ncbi:MAG: TonB family protein [Candidatus Eremiobacteraeota bacterium]|nr:TonB family protein [Candidatus Eremiobacteraeota bacterium]MBV8223283.1 TonB family protein [Candidatus Eremiobacteraeota bacterium]